MPVASPAILVAAATPVRFDFSQSRQKVRVQVRFFSTVEAQAGDEIAEGLGTRDVTGKTTDAVSTPADTPAADAYSNPALLSDWVNGTQTVPGGAHAEFEFIDGARNATFVCVVNTNPGGALSYRVLVSVVGAKVTVG